MGQKTGPQTHDHIILSNLNRFKKIFTGIFLGKFAVKCILKTYRTVHMLLHYCRNPRRVQNEFVPVNCIKSLRPLLSLFDSLSARAVRFSVAKNSKFA